MNTMKKLNNINTIGNISNDDIPVVEINVGAGENITKALEEKLIEDKRQNGSFQPRSLSSQLEKFN